MKKKMLNLTVIATVFVSSITLQSSYFKCNENSIQAVAETHFETSSPAVKSGLLNFTFKPENSYYLSGSTDTHFVYTKIKADTYNPTQSERISLNICMVIDRSGSMSGDRIKYVKEAAEFVTKNLTGEDFLSIVIYDQEVNVLLKPTLVKDKAMIISKIKEIYHRGSTNLCGGLLEGYAQVRNNYKSGYVNRVLLLSDGLANTGITDPNQIFQFAHAANQRDGITTSTFGVGLDFNENLMMGIAESGSGNYYFIQNPNQIPDIFNKELNGLISVVAQNAKVNIQLPAQAKILKVYGYENQSNNPSEIQILLRDISSDEEKTILFSYVIQPSLDKEIKFTANLIYEDAVNSNGLQNVIESFTVNSTTDKQLIVRNQDNEVVAQYALFHANWLLQNAMQMVDSRNYVEAKNYIQANEALKVKYGTIISSDSSFMAQDSLILNYGNNIDKYESMNDNDKKVFQKSNKAEVYRIEKKK